MSSNQVIAVVIIAVCLAAIAVVALLLRAQMSGEARLAGLRLKLTARREPEPESGTAVIEDSKSSRGGARATAPQKARISRTKVRRDIVARIETDDDPKG